MSSERTLQRSTRRFIATYHRARVDIHTRGFKQNPHQTPQIVNKYGYASFTDSSNLKYYPSIILPRTLIFYSALYFTALNLKLHGQCRQFYLSEVCNLISVDVRQAQQTAGLLLCTSPLRR